MERNLRFKIPIRLTDDKSKESNCILTICGMLCGTDIKILKSRDANDALIPKEVINLTPHPIFEARTETFFIRNTSMIPQLVKLDVDKVFVELSKKDITVPPFETKSLMVTMKDLKTKENKFSVRLVTEFKNHLYPFVIQGITPPVYFVNSFLQFEPVLIGSSKTMETVLCYNALTDPNESYEYEYTLGNPKIISSKVEELKAGEEATGYWNYADVNLKLPLKIYPKEALLQHGDKIKLQVTAGPGIPSIEELQELLQETQEAKKNKKDVVDTTEKANALQRMKLENFKNTKLQCVIPCIIKRYPSAKVQLQRLLSGVIEEDERFNEVEQVLDLGILMPIAKPDFTFLDEKEKEKVKHTVNVLFGQVIVGTTATKSVPIKVLTECNLRFNLLNGVDDVSCVFGLEQSKISTNMNELTFTCKTLVSGTYEAQFEISALKSKSIVNVSVMAVVPKLTVDKTILAFPETLIGEQNVGVFTVSNPCDFEMKAHISTSSEAFTVVGETNVPAKSSQEVSVVFKPMHATDDHSSLLKISYFGQAEEVNVELNGRAYETTIALLGLDKPKKGMLRGKSIEFNIVEDYLGPPAVDPTSTTSTNGSGKRINSAQEHVEPSRNIYKSYRFASYTVSSGQDLLLTNLKPQAKAENVGKKQSTSLGFTIEPFEGSFFFDEQSGRTVIAEDTVKNYHLLEPMSGNIEMGSTKKISFRSDDSNDGAVEKVSFFRIVLQGGYRVVEPKGIISGDEPTIYLLKVTE
jgi:hypothetical protein